MAIKDSAKHEAQVVKDSEDRAESSTVTAGQRKINLIWELTQSIISFMIVGANVVVSIYHGLGRAVVEYPPILSSMAFLVLGFYFARTNHAAIGGIGKKPLQDYQGR